MEKILRKVEDYTFEEYEKALESKPHTYASQMNHYLWAVEKHEEDLVYAIAKMGPLKSVQVRGTVILDKKKYKIHQVNMMIKDAMSKILTPDITDFSIIAGNYGKYYVNTWHSRGVNLFILSDV